MSVDFFIFAVLLLINALMTLAMLLASRTLGQPKMAYLLAAAFGGNVLLYVSDAIYYFLFRDNVWADMAVSAVAMVPPLFAAMAYHHRSGLPLHLRRMAASYALAMAIVLWFGLVDPNKGYRGAVVPFYAAGVLLYAMTAVVRPGRRIQPGELPIAITTICMAVVEAAGGVVQAAMRNSNSPALDQAYTLTVFLGLPAMTVAAGIFSLYLLAGDLAERLRRTAETDSLTGAPNRRAIETNGMRMMAEAHAARRPLTIAICDVDHFKEINDLHGHGHGDEVLCRLAALFDAELASPDHFGRLGGEEFVLFFPDRDVESARRIVEDLRARIMTMEVVGSASGLTASFGVAAMGADDVLLADILKRADRALYASKEAGRNRTTVDRQGQPAF